MKINNLYFLNKNSILFLYIITFSYYIFNCNNFQYTSNNNPIYEEFDDDHRDNSQHRFNWTGFRININDVLKSNRYNLGIILNNNFDNSYINLLFRLLCVYVYYKVLGAGLSYTLNCYNIYKNIYKTFLKEINTDNNILSEYQKNKDLFYAINRYNNFIVDNNINLFFNTNDFNGIKIDNIKISKSIVDNKLDNLFLVSKDSNLLDLSISKILSNVKLPYLVLNFDDNFKKDYFNLFINIYKNFSKSINKGVIIFKLDNYDNQIEDILYNILNLIDNQKFSLTFLVNDKNSISDQLLSYIDKSFFKTLTFKYLLYLDLNSNLKSFINFYKYHYNKLYLKNGDKKNFLLFNIIFKNENLKKIIDNICKYNYKFTFTYKLLKDILDNIYFILINKFKNNKDYSINNLQNDFDNLVDNIFNI